MPTIQPQERYALVVTGRPGSGRTTLAVTLAESLGLPLFSKDHIKELLADQLGADADDSPASEAQRHP